MNMLLRALSLIYLFNFTCTHSMECSLKDVQVQENKMSKDSRLLLGLPDDILRLVIRYRGNWRDCQKSTRSIFDVISYLKRVCKKLEQALNASNELKAICCLSQNDIDKSLLRSSIDSTRCDFGFLKLLIGMGADLTYHRKFGSTCLHYTSFNDDGKFGQYMTKLYLEHGAQANQIDSCGNTPLHCAATSGQTRIVKELLEHSAQFDIKNNNGDDPMDIALENKNFNLVKLLIAYKYEGEVSGRVSTMTVVSKRRKSSPSFPISKEWIQSYKELKFSSWSYKELESSSCCESECQACIIL